jgi:hypothetical protein
VRDEPFLAAKPDVSYHVVSMIYRSWLCTRPRPVAGVFTLIRCSQQCKTVLFG